MKICFIVFLTLIFSCRSIYYKDNPGLLIDDIAASLKKDLMLNYQSNEKISLAVVGFSRQDLIGPTAKYKRVTPKLGIMIANALQNEMFIPSKFDLLEREQVDSLLKETVFNQLGLTEEGSTQSLKLKGVHSILIGSIQMRGKSFRFDARIVELETGRVKSVASKVVEYYEFLENAYNDYPKKQEVCHTTIHANDEWQNTGCVLKYSSMLYLKAKGEWNMTNKPFYFDATGSIENPSNYGDYRLHKGANHGALLCRIGAKNIYIYKNNFAEDITGIEGVLECRINDTDVENNSGEILLIVETEESIH